MRRGLSGRGCCRARLADRPQPPRFGASQVDCVLQGMGANHPHPPDPTRGRDRYACRRPQGGRIRAVSRARRPPMPPALRRRPSHPRIAPGSSSTLKGGGRRLSRSPPFARRPQVTPEGDSYCFTSFFCDFPCPRVVISGEQESRCLIRREVVAVQVGLQPAPALSPETLREVPRCEGGLLMIGRLK